MKLVVLDGYTAVSNDLSLDCLNELCDDVKIYERTPNDKIIERIGDADCIIINKTPLPAETLSKCKNLKYIGLFATGYNVVDIEYCKKNNIVVSNAPSYSSNAVAQLVFSYILHFYSMPSQHNDRVHNGEWQNCKDFAFYDSRISELYGKTLGIIGFGSIGKKVAQIAAAFDMNILVYSRTVYPEFESDNLKFTSLETLLKTSDIVTLHCPLFKETENLIDEKALALMKPTALLINTSRGPVIDEYAVAKALNNNTLGYAAVDVVSKEPISSDNPLLSAKNCLITPHIAWACKESRKRLIGIVYDNLKAFLNGNPKNNVAL